MLTDVSKQPVNHIFKGQFLLRLLDQPSTTWPLNTVPKVRPQT